MEFIKAYFKGWALSFRKFGMCLVYYLFNFLFALLATLPIFNIVESKIGRSLAIEKLMPGFDFTVFADFMNQYGDNVLVLLDQSRFLIILFFILSIFLNGGILNVFKNRDKAFHMRTFWKGCTRYFWRLLRLTIYFGAVQICLAVGTYFLFIHYIGGAVGDLESELVFYRYLQIWVPIYLLIASIIMMIHDYAKVHLVHRDQFFLLVPIWQSVAMVFRHFLSVFSLSWLNLFTFLLVGWGYILLNRPADSARAILYTFLLGQLFIFLRIALKMVNLGSATIYYQDYMKKNTIEKHPTPILVTKTEESEKPKPSEKS